MNKNTILLPILMISVTACISNPTQNSTVNTKQLPSLEKICIQQNNTIDPSKQYLNIIVNKFENNAIKTQIYDQNKPSDCKYSLTYDIKTNWDVIPFVSRASLYLFDDGIQIHTAQYKVNSTFEMAKWKSAQSKIEPLVDQLSKK